MRALSAKLLARLRNLQNHHRELCRSSSTPLNRLLVPFFRLPVDDQSSSVRATTSSDRCVISHEALKRMLSPQTQFTVMQRRQAPGLCLTTKPLQALEHKWRAKTSRAALKNLLETIQVHLQMSRKSIRRPNPDPQSLPLAQLPALARAALLETKRLRRHRQLVNRLLLQVSSKSDVKEGIELALTQPSQPLMPRQGR